MAAGLHSAPAHAASAQDQAGTQFQILEHAHSHLDLKISLGEVLIEAAGQAAPGFFNVKIAGQSGMTQVVGAPALPVISKLIELPVRGELEVEILDSKQERMSVGKVAPLQAERTRCLAATLPFEMDQRYYQSSQSFPEQMATISSAVKLRGVAAAQLELAPVAYDPAQGSLIVTKEISLRIHIKSNGDLALRSMAPSHHRRPAGLDNYLLSLPKSEPTRDLRAKPNETMLVVLGKEEYRSEIERFARWKERRGINVVVKTTKELGGNTVDDIQKATQELYDDSKVDLAYLLLVGDKDVKAPTVKITSAGQMDSDGVGEADYRYTLLDGDDLVGDISVGRFSVASEEQLKSMVDKVLYYEKEMGQEDDDSDLSWIETAIGVASSEKATGPSDTQRMQKIIQSFKSSGYAKLDEFYQDARPKPDDLLEAINKGRGFISYMGHGNGSAWVFKSGFRFTNAHVEKVNAKKRWPIVMDCACTNGDFWNREPSFSEIWQRGSGDSDPFGALGIVSSTITAAWDPPAVMAEEMFAKAIEEPALTLGGMLTSGLLKMAESFPGSASMKLTRDTFVLFGDPSLNVRAFVPHPVKVKQNKKGESAKLSFEVMRDDPKKGEVAAYPAVVALSLDGELVVSASTDKEGAVSLEIPEDVDAKELDLVVTGHRLIAYEDTVKREVEEEETEKKESKKGSNNKEDESKKDSKNDEDEDSDSDDESSSKSSKKKKKKKRGGCSVNEDSGAMFGMLALLGLAGLRRRRQR